MLRALLATFLLNPTVAVENFERIEPGLMFDSWYKPSFSFLAKLIETPFGIELRKEKELPQSPNEENILFGAAPLVDGFLDGTLDPEVLNFAVKEEKASENPFTAPLSQPD